MASGVPGGGAGLDPVGGEGARDAHQAVEQHRDAVLSRGEQIAGGGGEVGAAEGGEGVDRVDGPSAGTLQRGVDDVGLVCQRIVVDAGAPADDLAGEDPESGRDQGGRRRGVADAHVPADQQLGARPDLLARDRRPRVQRLPGLLRREGVFEVDGAARPSDFVRGQRCSRRPVEVGEVVVDADVEHADGDGVGCGQGVDGGLAGKEGADHRAGDRGRERGHAVGGDAVVTREDDESDIVDRRGRYPPLGGRNPDAELSESSQCAGWGGEGGQPFAGVVAGDFGGRGDIGHGGTCQ